MAVVERQASKQHRGNKVCTDEKAHVFAFSIYRNPAREIVTRKCRPACWLRVMQIGLKAERAAFTNAPAPRRRSHARPRESRSQERARRDRRDRPDRLLEYSAVYTLPVFIA